MIAPTVGRRVWYYPNQFDRTRHPDRIDQADRAQPLDAGICYVWNERMVNLTVADQNGAMHRRASVWLLQDDDVVSEGEAYCCWVPYQKTQGEKHEIAR